MTPLLEDYIEKHISPEPTWLKEIDRSTHLHRLNGRMCSGHIQGRLLKMLTSMIKPQKVLELGSFTGYSALCIAEALDKNAEIHSVEADDELEDVIKNNLKSSPHGHKVTVHIGDALDVMNEFEENFFDLIVIDADKREYPRYLEMSLRLLKQGGYIVADNTLWYSHVVESGNHSSQTKGIMEFNELAMSLPGLEVAIIPMRDGLTLIRKAD